MQAFTLRAHSFARQTFDEDLGTCRYSKRSLRDYMLVSRIFSRGATPTFSRNVNDSLQNECRRERLTNEMLELCSRMNAWRVKECAREVNSLSARLTSLYN